MDAAAGGDAVEGRAGDEGGLFSSSEEKPQKLTGRKFQGCDAIKRRGPENKVGRLGGLEGSVIAGGLEGSASGGGMEGSVSGGGMEGPVIGGRMEGSASGGGMECSVIGGALGGKQWSLIEELDDAVECRGRVGGGLNSSSEEKENWSAGKDLGGRQWPVNKEGLGL